MNVYIVTKQGYEETSILGVFATKELAEEHITWCCDNTRKGNRGFNHRSQYDIIEETLVGEIK